MPKKSARTKSRSRARASQQLRELKSLDRWTKNSANLYSFESMKVVAEKYKLPIAATKASQVAVFSHYKREHELERKIEALNSYLDKLPSKTNKEQEQVCKTTVSKLKASLANQRKKTTNVRKKLAEAVRQYEALSEEEQERFDNIHFEWEKAQAEKERAAHKVVVLQKALKSKKEKSRRKVESDDDEEMEYPGNIFDEPDISQETNSANDAREMGQSDDDIDIVTDMMQREAKMEEEEARIVAIEEAQRAASVRADLGLSRSASRQQVSAHLDQARAEHIHQEEALRGLEEDAAKIDGAPVLEEESGDEPVEAPQPGLFRRMANYMWGTRANRNADDPDQQDRQEEGSEDEVDDIWNVRDNPDAQNQGDLQEEGSEDEVDGIWNVQGGGVRTRSGARTWVSRKRKAAPSKSKTKSKVGKSKSRGGKSRSKRKRKY